jgi:hypothetical protein
MATLVLLQHAQVRGMLVVPGFFLAATAAIRFTPFGPSFGFILHIRSHAALNFGKGGQPV